MHIVTISYGSFDSFIIVDIFLVVTMRWGADKGDYESRPDKRKRHPAPSESVSTAYRFSRTSLKCRQRALNSVQLLMCLFQLIPQPLFLLAIDHQDDTIVHHFYGNLLSGIKPRCG